MTDEPITLGSDPAVLIVFGVYLAVATVICVITWIDNNRTFYLNGPPSGLWSGLMWPFTAILWFVVIVAAIVFVVIYHGEQNDG